MNYTDQHKINGQNYRTKILRGRHLMKSRKKALSDIKNAISTSLTEPSNLLVHVYLVFHVHKI